MTKMITKSKKQSGNEGRGRLKVCLFAEFSTVTNGVLHGAIKGAKVKVTIKGDTKPTVAVTEEDGCVNIPLECGLYAIELPTLYDWEWKGDKLINIKVDDCETTEIKYIIPETQTGLELKLMTTGDDCIPKSCSFIPRGNSFLIKASIPNYLGSVSPRFFINNRALQKAQEFTDGDKVHHETSWLKPLP